MIIQAFLSIIFWIFNSIFSVIKLPQAPEALDTILQQIISFITAPVAFLRYIIGEPFAGIAITLLIVLIPSIYLIKLSLFIYKRIRG